LLLEVGGSVAPGQLADWPIDNPLGLGGAAGAVANQLTSIGGLLHVGSLAAALVCLVLRFRSSRGSSASSSAGSPPAPAAPWPGCWP
jgi:hypothetical protein